MRPLRGRSGPLLVVAALLLQLGALVAAPRVAAASGDGLEIQTSARYVLAPVAGVVRVTIDVTATNQTAPAGNGSGVTRYYFDTIQLPVQDAASHLRATDGGRALPIRQVERKGYDQATITLASRLFYHQTATFRVTYDLPGGKPRSSSDIRVGRAFAAFYAWALGDRGSVRIEIPSGFLVDTYGHAIQRSRGPAGLVMSATITNPGDWYVGVYATNDSGLTSARLHLQGSEAVVIKAWPEDKAWSAEVSSLLGRALPELEDLLGLSWPVAGDLEVSEVYTPLLEGYAGFYDSATEEIVVTEELDDHVIVHEASHAWFNKQLFKERWVSEGMADLYASLTLSALDLTPTHPNPVTPTGQGSFKLLDWTPPAPIKDDATQTRESFGYDASWTVMERLHREIGDDGMRKVLQAAHARTNPYLGSGDPDRLDGVADWRRLLDLLEEVGGSTQAESLFRDWVLPSARSVELGPRSAARGAYARLVEAGDGWLPPAAVRRPMAAWDFALAARRMAEATRVLETRDLLARESAIAGLTPPGGVQELYEHAQDSFEPAQALADRQLAALRAIVAAGAIVGAPRDTLVQVGLWDAVQPETQLAAARSQWAAGDLDAATGSLAAADATLTLAPDTGRQRVLLVGVATAGGVLVLGFGGFALARRRRRRRYVAIADIAEPDVAYATLAAHPTADGAPPPGGSEQPGESP